MVLYVFAVDVVGDDEVDQDQNQDKTPVQPDFQ